MTQNVTLALIIGVLLLVAMILAYRLVRRRPSSRHTRVGVFVERDFDKDEVDDDVTREWPAP